MLILFVAACCGVASDTIAASAPTVNGGRLPLGSIEKQIVMEDSAGPHILGKLTQRLSTATIGGRRGLLSVQTFEFGSKQTVDSSFADGKTLRPILHRSHNESRVMTLDFDGARVVGTVRPASGEAKSIDQTTAMATFDSNIADLVYAALPLADGYSATIPTYVYEEGGIVWTDISVTADAPIDGEAIWHVRAHSPKRDVDYWITRKSRTVLRSRYQIAPGRVLRIERSAH